MKTFKLFSVALVLVSTSALASPRLFTSDVLAREALTRVRLTFDRYNHRLTDYSQAQIDKNLASAKKFLTRFEAVDSTGFSEQDALTRTLMIRNLRELLDNAKFKAWQMPVDYLLGVRARRT